MSDSILSGKRVLIVDDEPDVLAVLEEEIKGACQSCIVERAETYEGATELLVSKTYDAVILDIMGVRGFDLLDTAVKRGFRVAMLTAHSLSPESLRRSIEMKAHAYLPKEKLGEVVPFLEDLLKYDYESGWKRLFEKLHEFFTGKFGRGWEVDPDAPWHEWLHGKYL